MSELHITSHHSVKRRRTGDDRKLLLKGCGNMLRRKWTKPIAWNMRDCCRKGL